MSFTHSIYTRLDHPWHTEILGPNGMPLPWAGGIREMRNRARRLESESALAYGILDRSVENVIGTGISIRPRSSSPEFNKEIADLWWQWTNSKQCDVRRMYSFGKLQRLAYRAMKRDGDCGFVLIDRMDRGYLWPEVQFIEGDLIESPPGQYSANIIDGIEFNSSNAPVAFWVRGAAKPQRVEARDFVFLINTCRGNVARGQSAFHGTYRLFDQLEGHIEAVVVAARIAACQAMIALKKRPQKALERLRNAGDTTARADGLEVAARLIEPGMINYIDAESGEDIKGFNPTQPHQDFKGFITTIARFLGLKFGLTVERVLLDFSGANYSVSRSTVMQEQRAAEPEQQDFDVSLFRRLYPWFVQKMIQRGRIRSQVPEDAWKYDYIPNGRPSLELSKEMSGFEKAFKYGIISPEEVATELGYDWEATLQALEKNKRELEALGLSLTGDVLEQLPPSDPE